MDRAGDSPGHSAHRGELPDIGGIRLTDASKLYLVGFLLAFAGITIAAIGSVGSGSGTVGGVVFIGPFPLVFGSGPGSGLVALTALVVGAVMVVTFYLFLARRPRQV